MRKMEALDQEHQSENYFKGLRKKNFKTQMICSLPKNKTTVNKLTVFVFWEEILPFPWPVVSAQSHASNLPPPL